jgi:multiple sugar transport system substrate-binding protein
MRKSFVVCLIIVLASSALAFGSGQEEPGPAATASGPVELKFWFHGGASREPYFKHMIDVMLPKAYPNIKAELEGFGSWGDMHQKALLAIAGGTPPDASTIKVMNVADLAIRDTIAALEPYFEKFNVDRTQWVSTLIDFEPVVNGKTYALPMWGDCLQWYRNEDMVAQAGIKEWPDTWDDLFAQAAKVKSATGVETPLMGPDINGTNFFFAALQQWGGSLLNPDYSKSMVNSPEARAALRFMYDWAHKSPVTNEYGTSAYDLVYNKQSAFWMYFGSVKDQYNKYAPDLNVVSFLMPKGPVNRKTTSFSAHMTMFTAGKHKDEAFQMINFMSANDEAQIYLSKDLGNQPVLKRVFEEPYLQEPYYRGSTVQHLEDHLWGRPTMPNALKIYSETGKMVQSVMLDEKTIDEALNDYETFINQVIEENKRLQ